MASKARRLKHKQYQVFTAVENHPNLLDMLEIATSPARKVIFIDSLLKVLPTAFHHLGNKSSEDLFSLFTAWFGEYPDSKTNFSRINAAIQHRQKNFLENRYKKRRFLTELGLDWTEEDKSVFFSTEVISAYDFIVISSFLS